MKKLLILAAILLIVIISIYVFIPSGIQVSAVTKAKTTMGGAYRTLTSKQQWQKWWNYNDNETPVNTDTSFTTDNYTYSLSEAGIDNILVSIQNNKKIVKSKLTLFQLPIDSIGIIWQCTFPSTNNPITRIQQYFEAVSLKKSFDEHLNSFRSFVENDENIYGMKILQSSIKDSFLISKKQLFTQLPTMKEVYALIDILKVYAAKNNCTQTNAPMLNILQDSGQYRVMVALPINKAITTAPPISLIKMVKGNFMVAQVRGGLGTVKNALQQMQYYFGDYNKTSMAIPFQYLITNRLQQPDTTKWVTEIYAPVL
ncbi:MAG: hypothetical protein JO072_15395 [Parafilimonas sp.]|nr:hypothetical protein [Parafilimonas sp.]